MSLSESSFSVFCFRFDIEKENEMWRKRNDKEIIKK
jgi:hypothetical protein